MTTPVLSQSHFRIRTDADTVNNTPSWAANVDTNAALFSDVVFRLRFTVQETAGGNPAAQTVKLQYQKNAGGYADVTTSSANVKAVNAGASAEDATISTKRLTGTGTFINGRYSEDGSAATSVDQSASSNTEYEFGLQFIYADLAPGDVINFRLVALAGTAIGVAATPAITIKKNLTAALFDSSVDTFYTPALIYRQDLTAPLYADTDAFFVPVRTGANSVIAPLYADTDAFYAPAVTGVKHLTAPLYVDADVFRIPVVEIPSGGATQDLTAPLYADADAFFAPVSHDLVAPGVYTFTARAYDGALYGTKEVTVTVGAAAPAAPDLTWTSGVAVANPVFNLPLVDAAAYDVVQFEVADENTFTPADYFSQITLHGSEINTTNMVLGLPPLVNGEWFVRCRYKHYDSPYSDWSDTVSKTLAIPAHINTVAISSTPNANGFYGIADTIQWTVTFDKVVDVTGIPELTFLVNATPAVAIYTGGTGTAALVFEYVALGGDTDNAGLSMNANSLALAGGTIKDVETLDALLTHAAVGHQSGHKVDTTAPAVGAFGPPDNSTNHAIDQNIGITFNDNIAFDSAVLITIKLTSDDSTFQEFTEDDIGMGLTISTDTLTITPTSDFDLNTEYYVLIDATSIKDLADNYFAGIASTTTWSFTTETGAPVTPYLVWTSGVSIIEPTLTLSSADVFIAGDVIDIQVADENTFTPVDDEVEDTLSSGEVGALELTPALTPLTDGTWYIRVRHKRAGGIYSDWSNTVSKTIISTPSTPVLVWTSDVDVAEPILTLSSTDAFLENDVIDVQVADENTFAPVDDEVEDTLSAGEAVAQQITPALTPLTDGAWYIRVRHKRAGGVYSDWSNTVTKTIAL